MRTHLAILILLILSKVSAEESNNYRFTHFTTSNGLPNSIIHCIYQGNKDFLWIGTNNGLVRFDGYEFKVFQPEPFNPNSIAHKAIENIIADDDGKLWLLFPSKNIDCFDPKTGNIIHYPGYSTSLASVDRKSTNIVFKDKNGNIWFGSNFGMSAFFKNSQSFKFFTHFQDIKIGKTYSITQDQNSNVYFGTEQGLFYYDSEIQIINQLKIDPKIDSAAISGVVTDKNGYLWITTYNYGYYCINLKSKNLIFRSEPNSLKSFHSIFESRNGDIFIFQNKPENNILYFQNGNKYSNTPNKFAFEPRHMAEFFNFAEDASQNVWFSGTTGLYMFDFQKKDITSFKNENSVASSLADNNTGPIFIDNNNVLWIGVYKVGIDKLDLNQKPFHYITEKSGYKQNTIPRSNILSILEDNNGNLWVGAYDADLYFRKKNKNEFQEIHLINSSNKSSTASISSIFQDRNGNIWAGSFYDGLFFINPETQKIKIFDKNSTPAFRASIIRKITEDHEGNLWFATTSHGLVEYNFQSEKFIYHSENNDKNYLDHGYYRTCYVDSRNRIWTGTQSGGILIFSNEGKLLKHLTHSPTNNKSLISNTIYSFFEDKGGIMWIGTAAGLEAYNEATGVFKHFTSKEGLPSNTVYSILTDSLNNFWLNTDNGLCWFNPKSEICKNYFETDGLISIDFNSTASFKGNNNKLYYGTSIGLLYFNPSEIKPNPYPSIPVITGLKILNEEIEPGEKLNNRIITHEDILYCKKLVLDYKEYMFSLAFTTLNFSSTDKVKYQYRLDPFDKGWFQTDANQRWVSYSNMKAGKYLFRVRATNSDGEWLSTANEVNLEIEILPPFWQTWWFRTAIALLLLGSAFIIYFSRIKNLKAKQKKLEILVTNRTRMWEESNLALEFQKQEITIQKEKLEFNNKLLREQQDRILHQNIELDTHRHHLEQMVEERTSELKEAREKAEEASRLKSAFLANMSHEIRTPMNAIVGFSNLVSNNEYTDEQQKEFINIIKKNSENLLVIIDDILDLSKIQSKQLMIVPRIFELKTFLQDIYRTFIITVQAKNLALTLITGNISDNDDVCTDPVRLKQIFINLINNAIKFTDQGTISFGITKIEEGIIEFFVKDTGYGISPEWHDAIFERFIKVNTKIGENHTGAGLGLAISKSLVELLGGKIWFESEVEKGTCFYFNIPMTLTNHSYADEPSITNTDLDNKLRGKAVLIVEDEDANYKVLYAFLKIKQITSVHVANGLEALELLKENPNFDAVLMDIRMPIMDGATALKHIREINRTIPIIAQTAYATIEERAEYEQMGFDYYLVKPISQQELYHTLYSVFTRK